MTFKSTDAGEGRPPTAPELLPILPIVFVVAWAARTFEQDPWISRGAAVAISLAGAGLVGLPVLFWALGRRAGLFPLILLGMLTGATPLVLIGLSAVLGLTVRQGPDLTLRLLETGVPIPAMGVMRWLTFGRAELSASAIGAASVAIYWGISVVTARTR